MPKNILGLQPSLPPSIVFGKMPAYATVSKYSTAQYMDVQNYGRTACHKSM